MKLLERLPGFLDRPRSGFAFGSGQEVEEEQEEALAHSMWVEVEVHQEVISLRRVPSSIFLLNKLS
jgi:hypothetical protein